MFWKERWRQREKRERQERLWETANALVTVGLVFAFAGAVLWMLPCDLLFGAALFFPGVAELFISGLIHKPA